MQQFSNFQTVWSFVVAIVFLGALCGSFLISITADIIGRKRGLYLSIGLGMVSGGASILAFFVGSYKTLCE